MRRCVAAHLRWRGRTIDFGIVALMCILGSGVDFSTAYQSGNPLWQAASSMILCIVLCRITYDTLLDMERLVYATLPLVLLVAWCVLSAFWSIDPNVTLRHSAVLIIFAVCFYHGTVSLGSRGMLHALGLGVGLLVVGSLVLIVFVPHLGTMQSLSGDAMESDHAGDWMGVFAHKNILGRAMIGCLVILWACASTSAGFARVCYATLAGVAGLLWLFSDSRTAQISGIAVIIVGAACLAFKRSRVDGISFVLIGWTVVTILCGYSVYWGLDDLFRLIGRSETFTGRTDIWNFAMSYFAGSPILGRGFVAFWRDAAGEITAFHDLISRDWNPTTAHNGWLDVAIQLGGIGVAIAALLVLHEIVGFFRRFREEACPETIWPILTLVLYVVTSMAESNMISTYDLTWTLYVCGYLSLFQTAANTVRKKAFA